ncbi:MAG: VCBS repeat-containing protein [bacterium]|nr:VCBS repeat-containing protein [bacterium]
MAEGPRFRREVIDTNPPGSLLDITLVGDLTGNGKPDIIIGGKAGEANLFWYENPSWTCHIIAVAPDLEAGGVCVDLTGNGRPDIVVGMQSGGNELYWFENPPDPRQPWPKHVIEDRFQKYHDQTLGTIDGRRVLLFSSQESGVIAYHTIPDDPRMSPWPRDNCTIVADDMPDVEGLAVVDIDGDGETEIIAGPNIFKRAQGQWKRHCFATDYQMTRVAVADLDGDGRLEIVLAEGESRPGRLSVYHGPDWTPKVLLDDLFHPHSLEIADFNGNGLPDIMTAEMGLGENPNPRMVIMLNQGGGEFVPFVFQEGVATHEAKVFDITGNGLPDIIGKAYAPERHVDIWYNESDAQ